MTLHRNCNKKEEKNKERCKQYHQYNKEMLQEMARDQYTKLSQDEKKLEKKKKNSKRQ